ncbi:MAG: thermonuclease family protein [Desulfovibrio sp.]|nr:thermonuclease family protein [Desulfovibrio sp.]
MPFRPLLSCLQALARRCTIVLCSCTFFVLFCLVNPLTVTGREALSQGLVALNFDGDTLKLTDRRVVRLAGIDTPEMGSKDARPQYYARESRALLTQLTKGKKVFLHAAGADNKDRHGRLIANVRLEDGRSLNEIMLAEGAAFFYPHKGMDLQLSQRLLAIQQKAIQERRGLWAHLLTLPVARQTYMGNRNSQRFFPSDCAEAQRIKPRNRVYYGTLMDAFLAGYAPARVCPFWPIQQ